MGRSLVSFTNVPLRFSQVPRSFPPPNHSTQCQVPRHNANSFSGYQKARVLTAKPTRTFCTKAVLSEIPYQKVGAKSTGPIPLSQLIQVVESAAKTGAEVWFNFLSFCWFFIFQRYLVPFFFLVFCNAFSADELLILLQLFMILFSLLFSRVTRLFIICGFFCSMHSHY